MGMLSNPRIKLIRADVALAIELNEAMKVRVAVQMVLFGNHNVVSMLKRSKAVSDLLLVEAIRLGNGKTNSGNVEIVLVLARNRSSEAVAGADLWMYVY